MKKPSRISIAISRQIDSITTMIYEYYKEHEMSRLALAILKRAVKRLEKCILQQERDFRKRR